MNQLSEAFREDITNYVVELNEENSPNILGNAITCVEAAIPEEYRKFLNWDGILEEVETLVG